MRGDELLSLLKRLRSRGAMTEAGYLEFAGSKEDAVAWVNQGLVVIMIDILHPEEGLIFMISPGVLYRLKEYEDAQTALSN